MNNCCTLIAVSDMDRSKQFYHDLLGLEVAADFGANVTLTGGIALQTVDSWTRLIQKDIRDLLEISRPAEQERAPKELTAEERAAHIKKLESAMQEAASRLEFELAAALRDQIIELKGAQ